MSAKNEKKPREATNLPANTSPKPAKTVLLVAQDVKFARALAYNDKKVRDRALKRLKKWFQQRYTAHRKCSIKFIQAGLIGGVCSVHRGGFLANLERFVLFDVDVG